MKSIGPEVSSRSPPSDATADAVPLPAVEIKLSNHFFHSFVLVGGLMLVVDYSAGAGVPRYGVPLDAGLR